MKISRGISTVITKVAPLRRHITNRVFLGIFWVICVLALLLKIIDGILLDLGFRNGEVHLNYWHQDNVQSWLAGDGENTKSALDALKHHPNTLWFMTQFTWLTTCMIILYLSVRFFIKQGTYVPHWLSWIVSQRTLTLITIYDLIVGIVFWAGMFKYFDQAFTSDLRGFQIFTTVLVHAVIPLILSGYSLIFLLRDPKAAILRGNFVFRAMLWPLVYMIFYIISTIVWSDPYAVTTMHDQLVADGWEGWSNDLWKFPVALIGIYVLIGILTTAHNIILVKFNKFYDPKKDSEMIASYERKVARVQAKAKRDYARSVKAEMTSTRKLSTKK